METSLPIQMTGTSHIRHAQKGSMAQYVNYRPEKGVLRAISHKDSLQIDNGSGVMVNVPLSLHEYTRHFVHKNSEWSHWIGVTAEGSVEWFNAVNGQPISIIGMVPNIKQIVSLKNFLLLITTSDIVKYLYVPTKYSYQLINIQDIPTPEVYLSLKEWDMDETTLCDLSVTRAAIIDEVYKFENQVSKIGKNVGMFWYRWAFRLYDGSHVFPSCPKLLLPIFPGDYQEFSNEALVYSMNVGINDGRKKGRMRFFSSSLYFNYDPDTFLFAQNLKDIIVGVDIYASKPARANKITAEDITFEMINVLTLDTYLNVNTFVPINTEVNSPDPESWYLIQSYDIKDMYTHDPAQTESYESKLIDLKDFWNNWSSRETLTNDTGSWHSLYGKTALIYNSTLMLGDISTKLSDSYNFQIINWTDFRRAIPAVSELVNYDAKTITKLLTDDGEVTVVSKIFQVKAVRETVAWKIVIPGTLAYPDHRAKSIEVVIKDASGLWYSIGTFALTPSENSNFSYYNNVDYTSSLEYKRNGNTKWQQWNLILATISGGVFIPSALNTLVPEPITTSGITITDQNRVIVSGLNNPLTFDPANSYRIGNGRIIAIGSNSEPLSQGQAGQHPVVIFTTEGIFGMAQGDFPVLFSSVFPISGDICLSDNLLPLRSSIIFLGERGITALTGRETTVLSQILNGKAFNPLLGSDIYDQITDNPFLFNSQAIIIASNDIRTYIDSTTCLSYDHVRDELIVFTPGQPFSWFFSMDDKVWYKCSQNWKSVINAWPESYVQDVNGNLLDVSRENTMIPVEAMLQSNPIIFDAFAGIDALELNGEITPAPGKYTGIYLFGEEREDNWFILGGNQFNTGVRNFKSKTFSRIKVSGTILIITSVIYSDSYLVPELTLSIKPKFNQIKS